MFPFPSFSKTFLHSQGQGQWSMGACKTAFLRPSSVRSIQIKDVSWGRRKRVTFLFMLSKILLLSPLLFERDIGQWTKVWDHLQWRERTTESNAILHPTLPSGISISILCFDWLRFYVFFIMISALIANCDCWTASEPIPTFKYLRSAQQSAIRCNCLVLQALVNTSCKSVYFIFAI
jgi:hypothetical protein